MRFTRSVGVERCENDRDINVQWKRKKTTLELRFYGIVPIPTVCAMSPQLSSPESSSVVCVVATVEEARRVAEPVLTAESGALCVVGEATHRQEREIASIASGTVVTSA